MMLPGQEQKGADRPFRMKSDNAGTTATRVYIGTSFVWLDVRWRTLWLHEWIREEHNRAKGRERSLNNWVALHKRYLKDWIASTYVLTIDCTASLPSLCIRHERGSVMISIVLPAPDIVTLMRRSTGCCARVQRFETVRYMEHLCRSLLAPCSRAESVRNDPSDAR